MERIPCQYPGPPAYLSPLGLSFFATAKAGMVLIVGTDMACWETMAYYTKSPAQLHPFEHK